MNNTKIYDKELANKIGIANDMELFGELYSRYGSIVFNKCYRFVLNTDEAKDLTQDVFLHVFLKMSSFKGNAKFSTWLYSVTNNFCVNYLNRDKEKKISNHSVQVEEQYHLASEFGEKNIHQTQINRLEKAMQLIPPEDKMILQLKYQEGISIKELHNILEISESAVKMRIARAKSKIANAYNNITEWK